MKFTAIYTLTTLIFVIIPNRSKDVRIERISKTLLLIDDVHSGALDGVRSNHYVEKVNAVLAQENKGLYAPFADASPPVEDILHVSIVL